MDKDRGNLEDGPYYNGDGGGIQIGFHTGMQNVGVIFNGFNFTGNRAERHGGAIAIQTAQKVEIKKCVFNNNIANADINQLSSLNLLYENHFNKKSEGRGGAIYINSAYTSISVACTGTQVSMENIDVIECEFNSNTGFDGYVMYVEGDETQKTALTSCRTLLWIIITCRTTIQSINSSMKA